MGLVERPIRARTTDDLDRPGASGAAASLGLARAGTATRIAARPRAERPAIGAPAAAAVAAAGMWFALVSTIGGWEALAGGLAAAAIAALVIAMTGAARVAFSPRPAWMKPVGKAFLFGLRDSVVLAGALVRRLAHGSTHGSFVDLPLGRAGRRSDGASRRMLFGALVSATPNSVVVDADLDEGVVRVHRLLDRPVPFEELL